MPNNDAPQTANNPIAAPPVAKRVPHTRTFHGREFVTRTTRRFAST